MNSINIQYQRTIAWNLSNQEKMDRVSVTKYIYPWFITHPVTESEIEFKINTRKFSKIISFENDRLLTISMNSFLKNKVL